MKKEQKRHCPDELVIRQRLDALASPPVSEVHEEVEDVLPLDPVRIAVLRDWTIPWTPHQGLEGNFPHLHLYFRVRSADMRS